MILTVYTRFSNHCPARARTATARHFLRQGTYYYHLVHLHLRRRQQPQWQITSLKWISMLLSTDWPTVFWTIPTLRTSFKDHKDHRTSGNCWTRKWSCPNHWHPLEDRRIRPFRARPCRQRPKSCQWCHHSWERLHLQKCWRLLRMSQGRYLYQRCRYCSR